MNNRICNKCKQVKEISAFYDYGRVYKNPRVNKERKDTVCKKCRYKVLKERRLLLRSTEEGRKSLKKYYRNYYWKNPEKNRERRRKYSKTAKGFYSILKKRNTVSISQKDFIDWYNKQSKFCYYCKISEEEARKELFGTMSNRLNIDRKDNNRGYEKSNIVLACSLCNRIKSNYFSESEMFKIAEIIKIKRSLL